MADDGFKKTFVAFRPDMVEASGEYRDGAACEGSPDFVHGLDGTPVGCRIGAQCAPRYYEVPGTGCLFGELVCTLPSVFAHSA